MLRLLCILFTLTLSSSFAQAQSCGTTFRVAVNESQPLYWFDTKTRSYLGLSADVLVELTKRTGCHFSPVVVNRSKLITEMNSARIDMVIVTLKNSTYDQVGEFLSLHKGNRELLLPKKFATKDQTVKDLIFKSKLKFMIHPGASFVFSDGEADFLKKSDRFVTSPSLEDAYRLIKKSKDLGVMQPHFIHAYFMRQYKMQNDFTILVDPTAYYDLGIYYVKKTTKPGEIQKIKKALQDMDSDGTWNRLNEKEY